MQMSQVCTAVLQHSCQHNLFSLWSLCEAVQSGHKEISPFIMRHLAQNTATPEYSNTEQLAWLQTPFWPDDGTTGKVRGSTKSLRLILWRPRIFSRNHFNLVSSFAIVYFASMFWMDPSNTTIFFFDGCLLCTS